MGDARSALAVAVMDFVRVGPGDCVGHMRSDIEASMLLELSMASELEQHVIANFIAQHVHQYLVRAGTDRVLGDENDRSLS